MSIYEIQENLLNIFDQLEESGGELTPELEEQLSIHQDEFKDKVEAYTNAIKLLEGDINLIKEEQKRLKSLADKKQKTIDRLKSILITAIDMFGDVKKSGVKYLDYGTGEISIRSTKSVELNDDLLDQIGHSIAMCVSFNKQVNQLDVIDKLDIKPIIDYINSDVSEEDINHAKLNLSIDIPIKSLFDGTGYPALREMAKVSDNLDINPFVSKSEIKQQLEQDGACAPHLAKISINKSIQIK